MAEIEVKNLDEFKKVLADAGDLLVVVDFFAEWCGPCKFIAPKLHELAEEFAGKVQVVKVDVDTADDVAAHCGINCMPTFHFYKNSTKVTEFSGANADKLRSTIEGNL